MGKKYYFASDFHLGIDGKISSGQRELLIVEWLDTIAEDATAIFLVGDVWDFYFEYGKVVPKGSIRLLGKLSELRDKNIPIHFFKGNHDMWMFRYLKEYLDIEIHSHPIEIELEGKRFLIGHGDGLGPGDKGYKRLKKVFRSKVAQFLFRWIHPDIGIGIADYWSKKSRQKGYGKEEEFYGEEEWLVQYCRKQLKTKDIDYFIFGHRHLPIHLNLGHSEYVNLGEWITQQCYAVFDGKSLQLRSYKNENVRIYRDL